MDVSALLPDSTALRLEEVTVSHGVARLVGSSIRRNGVALHAVNLAPEFTVITNANYRTFLGKA
jgi:hypothetical protein